MGIKEELANQGDWLFRWRGYLPLFILPLYLLGLRNSDYLERIAGDTANGLWECFAAAISMGGLFIRFLTVGYAPAGTSNRSTRRKKASALNTTGMYSVVRHPLYLGNFLILLGLTLFTQTWWLVMCAMFISWLYQERIIFSEEEFLQDRFGAAFLQWARRTPIFFPKLKNWRRPGRPFSFGRALKNEYTTVLVTVFSFTLFDTLGELVCENKIELHVTWGLLLLCSMISYLVLRTLKKRTGVLNSADR